LKLDVTSFDGQSAGSIELSDSVFGLEPRADLIARVIRWQLAKRRAGTHAVKNRADIARTGKKMYKQKGTGGARHGSARVPQFRGGGRAFGPLVRSHEHDLTKKVKALALRHALSSKAKDGAIVVWESAQLDAPKTKVLKAGFDKTGLSSALIIDGGALQVNFALAARNIPKIDVLPVEGVNVYDILRRETLILTRSAVDALEARLK
jgi:large subunit ribosomal protein L4